MEVYALNLIAALIIGFGLVSRRLRSSYVSPPMIFTIVGLAAGSAGLGWIDVDPLKEATRLLLELTLIIVLFTDAAAIHFRSFLKEQYVAMRLLVFGIPVCACVGGTFAYFIFDYFTFLEALLLAAVLTPTDAALAESCLSNSKIPKKLRETVEVEAGLNDGLVLPIIGFLVICETLVQVESEWKIGLLNILQQVCIALLAGAAVAYVGAKAILFARKAGWMNSVFLELSILALALLAFGLAEATGGNGFVSAFVSGLIFGHLAPELCPVVRQFARQEGQLLSLLAFLIFGAALVPLSYSIIDWPLFFFVLLFLSAVRACSVFISLIGSGVSWVDRLFLTWCGPRGIATILFGLFVLESVGAAPRLTLFGIANATVFASIFLHGLTALPVARWIDRQKTPRNSS